jgi:CheY-like chemotaxis protein/HPt (histidine-containing phosphotransfer) domain-containing protein
MKPRLLLLEDEPTSRMFLATALAELPVEIDTAQTVAQGRDLAAGGTHALWLFDANLPDGTGGGLLAELRGRGLSTPALVHTAAVETGERQRLLAQGFTNVVVKPLSAGAWRQAVSTALAQAPAPLPIGESPARYASTELPVWDDEAAIAALGGSRDNVDALRGLFLAELPAARDEIMAAAQAGNHAAMHDTLHRLRASCGFVGAARLDAAGHALRDAPGCATRLQTFMEAVEATAA